MLLWVSFKASLLKIIFLDENDGAGASTGDQKQPPLPWAGGKSQTFRGKDPIIEEPRTSDDSSAGEQPTPWFCGSGLALKVKPPFVLAQRMNPKIPLFPRVRPPLYFGYQYPPLQTDFFLQNDGDFRSRFSPTAIYLHFAGEGVFPPPRPVDGAKRSFCPPRPP